MSGKYEGDKGAKSSGDSGTSKEQGEKSSSKQSKEPQLPLQDEPVVNPQEPARREFQGNDPSASQPSATRPSATRPSATRPSTIQPSTSQTSTSQSQAEGVTESKETREVEQPAGNESESEGSIFTESSLTTETSLVGNTSSSQEEGKGKAKAQSAEKGASAAKAKGTLTLEDLMNKPEHMAEEAQASCSHKPQGKKAKHDVPDVDPDEQQMEPPTMKCFGEESYSMGAGPSSISSGYLADQSECTTIPPEVIGHTKSSTGSVGNLIDFGSSTHLPTNTPTSENPPTQWEEAMRVSQSEQCFQNIQGAAGPVTRSRRNLQPTLSVGAKPEERTSPVEGAEGGITPSNIPQVIERLEEYREEVERDPALGELASRLLTGGGATRVAQLSASETSDGTSGDSSQSELTSVTSLSDNVTEAATPEPNTEVAGVNTEDVTMPQAASEAPSEDGTVAGNPNTGSPSSSSPGTSVDAMETE